MTKNDAPGSALGPTRRTVARGVAWGVPVIAVGAAAPAMAASAAPGSISAACYPPTVSGGEFALAVTGSTSPSIQVVLTHSGDGSFSFVAPLGWGPGDVNGQTVTWVVPVVAGEASGTLVVDFALADGQAAAITVVISATTGPPLAGPTSARLDKARADAGGVPTYDCSST